MRWYRTKCKVGFLSKLPIVALALFAPVAIGQVLVSPVLVDLTAEKNMFSLSITAGTGIRSSVIYQVHVQKWEQRNGQSVNSDSDDLLVSPAIAEIEPGKTQVFRVGLRKPRPDKVETAYRIIFENVSEIDKSTVKPGTVTFRLSQDLPAFVAPLAPIVTTSHWSTCNAPKGKGCVRLSNDGNKRIRVSDLTIMGQGWQQVLREGNGTVLAGAWKEWQFDLEKGHSQPTSINAKTEQDVIKADLSVPVP